MNGNILIVDDEINTLKVLSATLRKEMFGVETSMTAEEALSRLKNKHYDLIISDFKLPGINGESLLEKVRAMDSRIPFVLLTAYGTIEHAVNAMRKGAYTYLTKPVNIEHLISVVRDALREMGYKSTGRLPDTDQFLNIIGKSGGMREVFSLIQRVSKTDASILILGESGTGKELVARAVHYTSLRADKPFIPIDCATIPSELMESELFGYEKGAFTCAYNDKVGLIEMANGGTVFFDEVGDLDFGLQKKLLRFLQEKELHRLGGKNRIRVDIRVLAATNRNIEDAVENGKFRADLYYRLNVITIHIPPLRERKEDIPLLATHFLKVFTNKNKKDIYGFDSGVMESLVNYDWPGNVRELENVVERAVILCPYDQINIDCLPRKLKMMGVDEPSIEDGFNLLETEKRIIIRALDAAGWNQTRAAEILGITRKQLRTKMKNHRLFQDRAASDQRA
ncbi:MAG: sigma-54 dependent transcriptional regulator [Thermodesulfovibrionales bacterium]